MWRLDGHGGGAQVAGYKADVPRIPASTMKLVTSAGALLQFGPAHRFTTTLFADPAAVRDGKVLRGAIYLRGSGDPVLSTRHYGAAYLGGRATPLAALGTGLKATGVRLVRGPIVADESLFDRRRLGPGWPSYYSLYISPLSALSINQGYAGSGRAAYVTSPTLAAGQRLRATLRGVGVQQVGPLRAGATPRGARVLARTTSPPLTVILRAMNLESDNFIAETLAKDVGAAGAGRGSTTAGVGRTRSLLLARGILGPQDALVDGSGLGRGNHLAASSLVKLIAQADADPTWGAALVNSLARGGEGTLIHRFTSGVATRRVRAKTGYIDGVSAMAGRVVSRRGVHYGFALIMNSTDILGARATQDRVVTLLAAGAED
ncbi:MAG TPA: D-alanyl-D-alanine carboxypeptidase [Miltoncostaea sp.]|nr:D-alanyl-D-alanine carboxypeptidase [Miltoncostaea sp.]